MQEKDTPFPSQKYRFSKPGEIETSTPVEVLVSLRRVDKKDAADYPCVNSKKSPFDQV